MLTYETALRRFFRLWRCIAPLAQYDDDDDDDDDDGFRDGYVFAVGIKK